MEWPCSVQTPWHQQLHGQGWSSPHIVLQRPIWTLDGGDFALPVLFWRTRGESSKKTCWQVSSAVLTGPSSLYTAAMQKQVDQPQAFHDLWCSQAMVKASCFGLQGWGIQALAPCPQPCPPSSFCRDHREVWGRNVECSHQFGKAGSAVGWNGCLPHSSSIWADYVIGWFFSEKLCLAQCMVFGKGPNVIPCGGQTS